MSMGLARLHEEIRANDPILDLARDRLCQVLTGHDAMDRGAHEHVVTVLDADAVHRGDGDLAVVDEVGEDGLLTCHIQVAGAPSGAVRRVVRVLLISPSRRFVSAPTGSRDDAAERARSRPSRSMRSKSAP